MPPIAIIKLSDYKLPKPLSNQTQGKVYKSAVLSSEDAIAEAGCQSDQLGPLFLIKLLNRSSSHYHRQRRVIFFEEQLNNLVR